MAANSSSSERGPLGRMGDSTPMSPLRTRQDDSWVEIASQPSSSSLSSVNDEAADTNGHAPMRIRRRRQLRPGAPSHLNISHTSSMHAGETSSQEEYDESESESDRVMTSSGEGPHIGLARAAQSDDDESRTAINYPTRRNTDACFTPQPNAFSRPLSTGTGRANTAPGSYFPATANSAPRPGARHSFTDHAARSHLPHNILSPSYNTAAHHDEALRASLTTLLSCAAAARGLAKSEPKKGQATIVQPARSNRVDPTSLRLVPESALPAHSPPQLHEPTFPPTLRRATSTSTSASSERTKENKRKALIGRSSSRERRLKKARRLSATSSSSSGDEVTPTLLTWVVSAGVVVFLGALSFTAGYTIGKEAGRIEGGMPLLDNVPAADKSLQTCARQASSLGLKRSLARSAVQV